MHFIYNDINLVVHLFNQRKMKAKKNIEYQINRGSTSMPTFLFSCKSTLLPTKNIIRFGFPDTAQHSINL